MLNLAVIATAAADPAAEGMGFMALAIQFLPIVAIFAIMYFVLIRPQRKKEKATREMLAQLKVGDNCVTIGGIVGKVCNIKDDIITLEIGQDKTKIKFERWAIKSTDEVAS